MRRCFTSPLPPGEAGRRPGEGNRFLSHLRKLKRGRSFAISAFLDGSLGPSRNLPGLVLAYLCGNAQAEHGVELKSLGLITQFSQFVDQVLNECG